MFVSRTMWSTPWARATSTVRSVEPSSMTSHSTVSKPGTSRGRSASVSGSVSSSFEAGDLDDQLHRDDERRYRARQTYGSHGGHHAHPAEPGHRSRTARDEVWDRGDRLAKIAFALLCLGFVIGFFVFPTYPVYDSYYSLLWGRDLLHGDGLVFDGFRYPTEHPLAIAAGAVLQLFGGWGDRLWVAMILASFLVLVAGVYRLGRIAATPLVGAVAAALLMTRFDYPFLAARGYIDIPYMALVVWAATLEAKHSRRGVPVLLLLALAGMLRPEAWFLAAMYWVWVAWKATWRERFIFAALAAIGPLTWARSTTWSPATRCSRCSTRRRSPRISAASGRSPSCPPAIPTFFQNLVSCRCSSPPGLGTRVRSRDLAAADADADRLLAAGLATFVAIGVAGASVIERYLAVPALALMVLAAVAIGGWTMLLPGWVRTVWMIGAAADRGLRRRASRRRG